MVALPLESIVSGYLPLIILQLLTHNLFEDSFDVSLPPVT